jgi:hypothetical protein
MRFENIVYKAAMNEFKEKFLLAAVASITGGVFSGLLTSSAGGAVAGPIGILAVLGIGTACLTVWSKEDAKNSIVDSIHKKINDNYSPDPLVDKFVSYFKKNQ